MIQYAAASRFYHEGSGILGHPNIGNRHCERSEAIHPAVYRDMDCFVASLLAMTVGIVSHSRGALRPRFAGNSSPSSIQRAQGMPGARCTRGLVCDGSKEFAHEHTGQRRASDIPCAMALRLIACSPRRTALLPPLRPEKLLPPGALTPAPRRQDHTSSPYAQAALVGRSFYVHRIPVPRS